MDVLGLLRFKESISGESLLPAQVGESGLDRAQVRGRHAHLVDDVGGRWHGRLGAYDRQAWVASEVEQRRLRLHRRPQHHRIRKVTPDGTIPRQPTAPQRQPPPVPVTEAEEREWRLPTRCHTTVASVVARTLHLRQARGAPPV
jgi:hypothetical protein